jgi:hypothetical protein
VDVPVTEGSEGVRAAQHATQTIPIVMRNVADPVQGGFIASLARPGGNITGLAGASGDLNGKRLELLKEALPTLTRVTVLWNPPQPAHAPHAEGPRRQSAGGRGPAAPRRRRKPHRLRGGVCRHAHRARRDPDDFWVGPALVPCPPLGGLGPAEWAARDGESICGKWGAHDVRTARATRWAALPTMWIACSQAPSRPTSPWNSPRSSSWSSTARRRRRSGSRFLRPLLILADEVIQ